MKKIYIVYEECHGAISYWDSMEGAIKEAKKVIGNNCESCENSCKNSIEECDLVSIDWHNINESWK